MTREEAISHLQKMIGGWQCDVITAINIAIKALEQPEQIKGNWLSSAEGTICSNCGYKLKTTALLSHCPFCGVEMEEEK